ncbi:MAG: hypothetical protein IT376_03195 [Polyangiaceae bacterium]|nr:hypothetical protein [Polyangiaceae bacterium]
MSAAGSWWLPFEFERRWLVELLAVVVPSGADPRARFGAADVPARAFVDDLLVSAPLEFVLGLRGCVWVLMLCPVFCGARFTTFLGLTPAERLRVLSALRESPSYVVRELPLLLKMVACLAVCGLPEVQGSLDLEPRDATLPEWAQGTGAGGAP